jgi:hypothetical protein
LRGPPVTRTEGAFEVDSADYPSAQAVLSLAQHLRAILSKDLKWPGFLPGTIHIQLVAAATMDFSGPYSVSVDRDGFHTAFIRWGADTALSDVCLALSRVTVESVATWHNAATADKVPEWLKLAYGKILEAETKPAIVDEFSSLARQQPILSLRQIMTAQNPSADDLPALALNAFWLGRFFEDQCHSSAESSQLFGALVSGGDPVQALTAVFPSRFADARDLELWWEVGCRDLTKRHLPLVLSFAQSRDLLDHLQFVDVASPTAEPVHSRLDDAWPSRADKTIQQQLVTVMLNAGPLPFQINPIYKNTLLSLLGAIKQMSGNDENSFRTAWAAYLADRADAESIEAGVVKAMSAP